MGRRLSMTRGRSSGSVVDDAASVLSPVACAGDGAGRSGRDDSQRVQDYINRCSPQDILLGNSRKADLYAARRFRDKTTDKGAKIRINKLLDACALAEDLSVAWLPSLREPLRSEKLQDIQRARNMSFPLGWCKTLIEALLRLEPKSYPTAPHQ